MTMRVLIAAENASTQLGGEAILPYHYFRLLRRRGVDAHLVVHARTRDELMRLFGDEVERLHFVEDMTLQKLLYKLGRLLPRRIDEATLGMINQFLTQWTQRGLLRRLVVEDCVVHQPIPVSPRTPSLLFDLDMPVVIGPLNGGMEYPPAFRSAESVVSRVVVSLGRSVSDIFNLLLPGKRRAEIVLVANERTAAALPSGLSGRVMLLPENAVDLGRWHRRGDDRQSGRSGRFVFVGRLVDWKSLDIVLDALVHSQEASLDVIGDGPMISVWREMAMRLGVAERVEFLGWMDQEACAEHLSGCCGLVLPSLHECGGAVVLEAMALGLPVIATAWGGPLEYLDGSCGYLVKPVSREALVQGFAVAMQALVTSPELCRQMGEAGRLRVVAEFDWERKIDTMLAIYEAVVGIQQGTLA